MSTMTISPTTTRFRTTSSRTTSSRTTSSRTVSPRTVDPRLRELRLTRRGRLVVLLGALLAVLVLGVGMTSGSVATEQPGSPEPTLVVTVQPGDTLYGIASTVTTDGDVAAMVERIQTINALDSGMLAAGQRIEVPVTTE